MKAKFSATLVLAVFLLSVVAITVTAVNSPGVVTVQQSDRRIQSTNGASVPAQAGNVSQLIIDDTHVTGHWQGYYGTVSGTIKLDDAKNNTLFDWQLADPSGEIYATNGSAISWTNITCVNLTGSAPTGSRSTLNSSIIETAFNITATEMDGVNETFNYTYGGQFTVGAIQIDSSYNCPLAYTYVSNVSQQASFKEVMLTDNESVVFTALLEHNQEGYNGASIDFQMLVPTSSVSGTDYFLFVELN